MALLRRFSVLQKHYRVSFRKSLVEQKKIYEDARQIALLPQLQRLYDDLKTEDKVVTTQVQEDAGSWIWGGTTTKTVQKVVRSYVQGIYLYGGPGSGKTFLMDMFYNLCPLTTKRRVHFNRFMLEVHQAIHRYNQDPDLPSEKRGQDPVPLVAQDISNQTRLLCFDEFQVTDIADAMILRRLFGSLWEYRVVVLATSNRPPDDLYYNGLQRFLFIPFIHELKQHNVIIEKHCRPQIWGHRKTSYDFYLPPRQYG